MQRYAARGRRVLMCSRARAHGDLAVAVSPPHTFTPTARLQLRQELREARQRKKKLEQLQAWQDEKKRREAEEQAAEEQYQAAVAAEEARRERKCVLLAACAYPHRRSHRDRRQQRDAEVKRALAERRAYRPGT